jgi:hypothetical protein
MSARNTTKKGTRATTDILVAWYKRCELTLSLSNTDDPTYCCSILKDSSRRRWAAREK